MLISHEVPLALLKDSLNFNDYDYCLLHLVSQQPEYRKFYKDCVAKGRKVLLDNSLFELGDSLSEEQLVEGIKDIQPTWYVVPDCWENSEVTKERFLSFEKYIKDLPGIPIGVVQGDTVESLIDCYIFMRERAQKIALPFGIKAFIEMYERKYGKSSNDQTPDLVKLCVGRQAFINLLIDNYIWNYKKPHHLLGCTLAREYHNPVYHDPKFNIESCDTSNPVVAGLLGMRYYGLVGLKEKPDIKLCDLIEAEVSNKQKEDILYNIQTFRQIANG